MRILRPTDGHEASVRRLHRLMLNYERGALAFDAAGAPLPPPHAPFPLIVVPPLTERGFACHVHMKPAVGFVFYTPRPGLSPRKLAEELGKAFEAEAGAGGDAHLLGQTTIAASPFAVIRQRSRAVPGTALIGPRAPFQQAVPADAGGVTIPARLLQWTPGCADCWVRGRIGNWQSDDTWENSALDVIPHFSARARFTWYIMPVAVALSRSETVSLPIHLNALVASIVYDAALCSILEEGVDHYRLDVGDFSCRPLPAELEPLMCAAPTANHVRPRFDKDPCRMLRSIIVWPSSVGQAGERQPADGQRCWFSVIGFGEIVPAKMSLRSIAHLPLEIWNPASIVMPADGIPTCAMCCGPASGQAVVLRGARVPRGPAGGGSRQDAKAEPLHREWCMLSAPPGSLLTPPRMGVLLCLVCWSCIRTDDCAEKHLDASLSRVQLPPLGVSLVAHPTLSGFGRLLDFPARLVPGAPGVVVIDAIKDGAPAPIALVSGIYGNCPHLENSTIAGLDMPILPRTPLAFADLGGE